MEIGSEAHKELFCHTFVEGHRRYEPEDLPWPELDAETLELLRGIPFWEHALQAELDAGPMVYACAEASSDPLVREALNLQGYEETRHGRTIQHMIDLYGIEVPPIDTSVPLDVESAFVDFGFEECLDSFGAFGLFALAREADLVPDEFFQIFGQVMQEEAHHIVFFVNWFAWRQAQRGGSARVLRAPRTLWQYGKALYKLGDLVRDDGADEGADFIATGASAFVDDLTPHMVLTRCVSENERRLAGFDRRLLVPRLVPRLARVAMAGTRWLSDGNVASRDAATPDSSSRAA